MLFKQGVALTAYASFTEAGARASGTPVPTVSVYRNGVRIQDDQDATHINDGVFSFMLAAGSNNADGSYVFSFFLTGSDQKVVDVEHQVHDALMNSLPTQVETIYEAGYEPVATSGGPVGRVTYPRN